MKKTSVSLVVLALCLLPALAWSLPKVAVLDLTVQEGIDAKVVPPVTESLMEQIVGARAYVVLDRAYIDQVLREKEFQLSGMVSDTQAAQAGQYLGADYVVAGKIQLIGDIYLVVSKMIEVRTGVIVAQSSGQGEGKVSILLDIARAVGKKLVSSAPISALAPSEPARTDAAAGDQAQIAPAEEDSLYIITTVAGTGAWTSTGDGGPAAKATIKNVNGLALALDGTLYFSDAGAGRIRRIRPDGIVESCATASFEFPQGLALDSQGNLFIAESNACKIKRISPDGAITLIAGGGPSYRFGGDGGSAVAASLNYPVGLALDAAGNIYIADTGNNRIRKVSTSGIISTVAGRNSAGSAGDEGFAIAAQLNKPSGVALDRAGRLYIADTENHRVRMVDENGRIHTIAGTGVRGALGDGGQAGKAQLNAPKGVAIDARGRVFIAEWGNSCVRLVRGDGGIATIVGVAGRQGWNSGDGGLATDALLMNPIAVLVDGRDALLIADEKGDVIRKASPR